jgi:hypothetical protein
MGIELLCAVVVALLVGIWACFSGYRFFLILLPIWGFIAGFLLGAGAMETLFGVGFLSMVTSWIVGFVLGLILATLSYFFWFIGVAIFAGSFGFSLGAGFMYLLGFNPGLLSWLVGISAAIVVALLVLLLNVQKWFIVVITAFGGATAIIGSILLMFGRVPLEEFSRNAVRLVIDDSWLWIVVWLVLAVAGIVTQARTTSSWELALEETRYA